MKPLEQSHVPGLVLSALCVLVVTPGEVPIPGEVLISEEIMEKLRASVARIAVNSTPCSVTCGPGLKVEELCEVTPAGEMRSCSLVSSYCLGSSLCGLQHLTVPAGQPLQLPCLAPDAPRPGNHSYSYTWGLARGLITTNDLLFEPLKNSSPGLSFDPAREPHAGTYRCDVHLLGTPKLIKRVYFGLRVIPGDLVGLNFQQALSWEQNLKEGSAGNGSREGLERFWEREEFMEAVLGIGSGVLGSILLSLLLCCCQRLWRRRRAEK
ncbi:transmembrane protein 81 isoform X3 [Neopelma chrysocephalum]|uniref:transmembrane protein 81 isoform X3 n=1 Tax=Neopelma chrysocephalum TaxID=114329 RepID=UPI000FCCF385|nr:transmembrane protein 81 isoform X3 [Neopelma chrysocephalum]